MSARSVAHYLLSLVDEDAGDLMSNLKLQKLLYYCQGVHLAVHGCPLFEDPIEVWEHGPVVAEIYHEFKKYGADPIEGALDQARAEEITEEQRELINDVHNHFGQFSAWKLRNMTHQEPPWRNAKLEGQTEISHKALKEYFETIVSDDGEE